MSVRSHRRLRSRVAAVASMALIAAGTAAFAPVGTGAVVTAAADCFEPHASEFGGRGNGQVRVDPHTARLPEVPTVQARLAAGSVRIPTYVNVITAKALTADQQTAREQQVVRQVQSAQPRVLRTECR